MITNRMFLGVGVEDLRLLPGLQGVVDQSGQHHVVVEVGVVRVLVQVDRVEEDPQPVRGEPREGVPEGYTVALGASRGQERRLYEGGLAGVPLGERGGLQEDVPSLQAAMVVMVMSGASDPEGIVPFAGPPPDEIS